MAGFDGKDVPRDEDADHEDEDQPFRTMAELMDDLAVAGDITTPLDYIAFLRSYLKEKLATMIEIDELVAEGIPVREQGLVELTFSDYDIVAVVAGLQILTLFGEARLAEEATTLLHRIKDATAKEEMSPEQQKQIDEAYERIAVRKQGEMMKSFLMGTMGLSEEDANKAVEESLADDSWAASVEDAPLQ